jgi:hypothetical protein
MQKFTQTIVRKDGSEVRIIATPMASINGVDVSVDIYVLHRESPAHEWRVANNRPHPDWRRMSVNEYIKHGRSEMLQIASPCEILKVSRAVFANGHS